MPTLFLDPGMLASRLTLEKADDAPDGQGGVVRTWAAVASLWGKVEPVSGSARELAGQAGQVVTHRVYVRARTGIALGMRFVKFQKMFEIKAIHDPDESGRYLVCLCEETRP